MIPMGSFGRLSPGFGDVVSMQSPEVQALRGQLRSDAGMSAAPVVSGTPQMSAMPGMRARTSPEIGQRSMWNMFPSFKRGGKVTREGLYHLHRGERVLNLAKAISYAKSKRK